MSFRYLQTGFDSRVWDVTKYEYGVSECFVASLNNDVVKHIYSDKAQAENEVRYLRVKYPKGRFKLYEREYHEWQEIDL